MDKKQISRNILIAIGILVLIAIMFLMLLSGDSNQKSSNQEQENGKNLNDASLLVSNSWTWKENVYSNDTFIKVKNPEKFIITFNDDGSWNASTDCNGMSGSYILGEDGKIEFGNIASTLMYCAGETQENLFMDTLFLIGKYSIDDKGELSLVLNYDAGAMLFDPVKYY